MLKNCNDAIDQLEGSTALAEEVKCTDHIELVWVYFEFLFLNENGLKILIFSVCLSSYLGQKTKSADDVDVIDVSCATVNLTLKLVQDFKLVHL